eukprot:913950-Rhodomonas_salina.2
MSMRRRSLQDPADDAPGRRGRRQMADAVAAQCDMITGVEECKAVLRLLEDVTTPRTHERNLRELVYGVHFSLALIQRNLGLNSAPGYARLLARLAHDLSMCIETLLADASVGFHGPRRRVVEELGHRALLLELTLLA